MGQFIDSIKAVKQNYSKYDDWEQKQADERAKKEYLAQTLDVPKDKVELTQRKAEAVIRATEILDRYSEDNCEDMEQATNMVAMLPLAGIPLLGNWVTGKWTQSSGKKIQNKIDSLSAGLVNDLGEIVPNKDEINANIKALENKLTKIKTRYPIYGLGISTLIGIGATASFILWGNSKQKEASRIGRFQARQNELKDIRNFVMFTPEQIKQAEELAKNIPDEKEKNKFVKMFKELKAIHKDKKAYKEWFASKDPEMINKLKNMTYTKEQLDAAKSDQELIVDAVKEINIKAEEYSENIENAFDTLGTVSWIIAAPAGWLINSVMKLVKVPGKIRGIVSVAVPTLTSLVLSTSGTMVQKDAARVGRYVARKDLSSNPARLMAYSDEDFKKAENIKAPKQKKSVFEKIAQSYKFLLQYFKDAKEYTEYRKTVQSNQEKMHKAYADMKITDKQKADAENLQRKVFLAFDEIDEMSQRYSEDVEAGSEIFKNIFSQFWSLGSTAAIGMTGLAIARGKFPVSKVINSVVNMGFTKDSTIRNGINELYDVLKSDKKLMHNFQYALVNGEFLSFLTNAPEAFQKPCVKLMSNVAQTFSRVNPNKPETYKGILDDQLKQGPFAKWVRNLVLESGDLYLRKKAELPTPPLEYKTILGTSAIAGLPLLGLIVSAPYAVNAWLTNVQKKAGKIGIMAAMEKIDDPRVFADPSNKQ